MSLRIRIWLLAIMVGVPLSLFVMNGIGVAHWVGRTDLEIEFVVTDATTGSPIHNAPVEVQTAEEGLHAEYEPILTSSTNSNGVVQTLQHDTRSFGKQSLLGLNDSFFVHIPQWRFRVNAEGYAPTGWLHLPQKVNQKKQLQRVGVGKSKLIVPVELKKSLQTRTGNQR